jgi:hypothetical protein
MSYSVPIVSIVDHYMYGIATPAPLRHTAPDVRIAADVQTVKPHVRVFQEETLPRTPVSEYTASGIPLPTAMNGRPAVSTWCCVLPYLKLVTTMRCSICRVGCCSEKASMLACSQSLGCCGHVHTQHICEDRASVKDTHGCCGRAGCPTAYPSAPASLDYG